MAASKELRIKIKSVLYEVEASLFSEDTEEQLFEEEQEQAEAPDILEINTVATLIDDGERITLSYEETEENGMGGSVTSITYLKKSPQIVTMTRDGAVSATLVFEEGNRNHCIYKTPFMPFEVCVYTKKVQNFILSTGLLELDYFVEIRGAKAERTKFTMKLLY